MNRRVWQASALAIALHGPLVAAACYRLSFDAYTHMFFADHYQRNWWVLWEPRKDEMVWAHEMAWNE